MNIVLKLQSGSLSWRLTNWDSPPLSCNFCLGSFICSLDLLLKGMRRAAAKFHPKRSHACKWFKTPSCPCNWLQRAPRKVTQDILKWGSALKNMEMFFCKSHLLMRSLCWTRATHPPHKAGNAALRRQVGRSRASCTSFSCRRRRSRGLPQCPRCLYIWLQWHWKNRNKSSNCYYLLQNLLWVPSCRT